MSDIYTRSQSTASRLLTRYNQGVITYTPLVAGANDWDAKVPGTPVALDATATGVQKQYIDDLVTSSDLQVTCAVFGQVPDTSGIVTIDSIDRQIIKFQQIPAAGTPVAWRIFVKG